MHRKCEMTIWIDLSLDWTNLTSLNGLKERTSTHLEPIWSSRALQCVSTLISTSFFAAFPTDLLESKQLDLLALWLTSFAWFGQFTKSITLGRDFSIYGQKRLHNYHWPFQILKWKTLFQERFMINSINKVFSKYIV